MASKKNHSARIAALPGRALPSRALSSHSWVARGTTVLLAFCGLSLLVMSKTQNPAVTRLRTGLEELITPVLAVSARPLDALSDAGAWLRDLSLMQSENVALKNENAQLLQWQESAKQMQAENTALRALLHVVPEQKKNYITARVVSDMGGPYVRSALINGGLEDGIHKDQPVINGQGLIGRIVEASSGSARVLLLSDINSRVPVVTERSRAKSILSGNNDALPTLSYLNEGNKVEVGERVVTSGDGGVFPVGLPVGVVTSVENGAVRVQPFVDAPSLEYVSVIDYSL